ncbi:MAG: DUF4262 domain-containing protein [Microbacterium sp.]
MTRTSDLAVQAWLAQEDKHTADVIRAHGVHIQYVGDDQCSCCARFGDATDDAQRDEQPPFAYTVGTFGIGHPELLMVAANRFYRRPPEHSMPLLQLTYDDKQRRFPWEEGYAIPPWIPPGPEGSTRECAISGYAELRC